MHNLLMMIVYKTFRFDHRCCQIHAKNVNNAFSNVHTDGVDVYKPNVKPVVTCHRLFAIFFLIYILIGELRPNHTIPKRDTLPRRTMTAHPGALSMDTLHNSCRICSSVVASTVPLNNLPDTSSSSLADMLRYCVNLEVGGIRSKLVQDRIRSCPFQINEYDGLPYQCCEQCKADLVVAYKLVIRCHQSDAKFRGLLMESKTDAR